jgi:hypothetical protein
VADGSNPNNKKQSGIAEQEALLGNVAVGSKPNNKMQSGAIADSATEAVAKAGKVATAASANNNNKTQ